MHLPKATLTRTDRTPGKTNPVTAGEKKRQREAHAHTRTHTQTEVGGA